HAGFSAGDGGSDQPYFYVASRDETAGAPPQPDGVLTAASLLQERRPGEVALDRLRAAIGALRAPSGR
ncbi:MAG: hypothetical protein WBW74_07400, partial [Xanthobacteraceae bacterium]